MGALVAAIHVFCAASKDVDGRDEPGHDVEKTPVVNTEIKPDSRGIDPAMTRNDVSRINDSGY
jgi:hypothetical protein